MATYPFLSVLFILVDIFFMKTCRFRGAQPRKFKKSDETSDDDEIEGIFSQAEPTARYQMTFCRQENCFLCQWEQLRMELMLPSRQLQLQLDKQNKIIPGVDFLTQQAHRFVNQYEAILNCPAVSSVVVAVLVEKHAISLVFHL